MEAILHKSRLLVASLVLISACGLPAEPIVNSERAGPTTGLEISERTLVWARGTFLVWVVVVIAAMVPAILEPARALDRGVLARAGREPAESSVGADGA